MKKRSTQSPLSFLHKWDMYNPHTSSQRTKSELWKIWPHWCVLRVQSWSKQNEMKEVGQNCTEAIQWQTCEWQKDYHQNNKRVPSWALFFILFWNSISFAKEKNIHHTVTKKICISWRKNCSAKTAQLNKGA